MDRRDFNKYLLHTIPAAYLYPMSSKQKLDSKVSTFLKPGDTVGLIAPSGPLKDDRFQKAFKTMESFGFLVKHTDHIYKKYGYLAGTDEERLSDIHTMYRDKSVKAIWCLRGGYGTARLLYDLDYKLIKANPKPLIGYSDITALLLAINQKTGQQGFHANIAASDYTDFTFNHTRDMLMGNQKHFIFEADSEEEKGVLYEPYTITPGMVDGPLIGGNLTLLASMVGTKFNPKYKNKIVFIEDVGEKPYRIDRMLVQMMQGTDLQQAAGIVFGHFIDCNGEDEAFTFTLRETLTKLIAPLKIPAYYGAPFGHRKNIAPIPIGATGTINAEKMQLTIAI
ncbi:MAG TPA: LD-carboxypeptidase [Saprospiraceae bacterium]|nr:LD-carboxypeptidase [Saprospiraceae bacterium]HPN68244.1 LD-carboxypeptidase [Saprospiraceae bacterium]